MYGEKSFGFQQSDACPLLEAKSLKEYVEQCIRILSTEKNFWIEQVIVFTMDGLEEKRVNGFDCHFWAARDRSAEAVFSFKHQSREYLLMWALTSPAQIVNNTQRSMPQNLI